MQKYTELTPAYGRDYKNKAQVLADWEAGKDFIIANFFDAWDGKPANKQDLDPVYDRILIRYANLTKLVKVKG